MWRTLNRLRNEWNRHAETDPLWAIYTDPQKKNGGWEPGAFFETGRQEVEELMSYVGSLNVELGCHRALDFGCGVGRLGRALASHFDEVCGVDISPKMIELAHEYNGHLQNCRFLQNTRPDFRAFSVNDFDLIYSSVTLQHIPPRHAMRYLHGLIGLLRPGGLLIFQLPSEKRAKLAD